MEKLQNDISIKKETNILNTGLKAVVFLISIFTIIAFCIENNKGKYPVCIRAARISGKFFTPENSYIIDGFCMIWGLTITIILFFLEFYNTYWYGVTFKRIVNLAIYNKIWFVIAAIEYIGLCPLAYISITYGMYTIALWCIICSFVIFVIVPIFIVVITRREYITPLLINSTLWQLNDKIKGYENSDASIQMRGNIQTELERLPITTMLEHTNYDDIVDIQNLLNTLTKIFAEKNIHTLIRDTVFRHAIVMVWIERMIEKSGSDSEREQNRTVYMVRTLWEKLISSIEKLDGTKEKELTAYSVEILLPLMRKSTQGGKRVFNLVWKSMGEARLHTLLYLLLYAEYCYFEQLEDDSQESYKILDEIHAEYRSVGK